MAVLLLGAGCTGTIVSGPDGSVPLADGGTGGGSGSCAAGTHPCSTGCVSDDAPSTCGSSCAPCTAPANATATCTAGACGFACAAGFDRCLGKCLPADAGTCAVNLAANTWAKLTEGDTGTRSQAAMVYLPARGAYVLVGGARTHDPSPYDVQALTLADPYWRNEFPPGKAWGPELGNSTAPGFATERFEEKDTTGFARPSFEVYGGMYSYQQYAWLPQSNRLLFYLWNHTFSYDAAARSWTFHAPATDPGKGPMEPRLLWSAMTPDATGGKVLLFGGANVHADPSTPGTWLYEVATSTWRKVAGAEPPPRAYASLATDPEKNKALLFGGDQLDVLLADTWVFDFATEAWTRVMPPKGPSPRAGHKLLYLPQSKQTVLVGGWTYSSTTDYVASPYDVLPWEVWRFDWAASAWTLVKHFAPPEPTPPFYPSATGASFTFAAAVGADDIAVIHFKTGYPNDLGKAQAWALKLDPSVTDAAGTATWGVAPDAVTTRTGRYDPAWFGDAGVPSAGEQAMNQQRIDTAPDNAWVAVAAPNRPRTNHDWGTAAFDTDRLQLFRWSGGHSAWSGTDVLHYDVRGNRFSIGYRPELPLEFTFTNDQTPGHWSPKGRPWMNVHTYKTYAYSGALQRMTILKLPYTYFYDPVAMEFDAARVKQDLGGNQYVNTLTPIPAGMMAWTPDGLFTLTSRAGPWTKLTPTGAALPGMSPDCQTAVYDAAGSRLLMFSTVGAAKGEVYSYGLATNTVTALGPMGKAAFAAGAGGFLREAVLLPSQGLVVFAIDYPTMRVPVYDVAANRWFALKLTAQAYGNSFAIVHDPANERIWGLGQNNEVFLLKVNKATADLLPL